MNFRWTFAPEYWCEGNRTSIYLFVGTTNDDGHAQKNQWIMTPICGCKLYFRGQSGARVYDVYFWGMQAAWRMHQVLRHTAAVRAATCIQKHWAMLRFRRALHQHQAARSIQTRWRGHAARQHATCCRAARSIQSCWRGWLTRRMLLLDQCATRIQRYWLSRQQRLAFLKLKHHCIQVGICL